MDELKEAINSIFEDKLNNDDMGKILVVIEEKVSTLAEKKLEEFKKEYEVKAKEELVEWKHEQEKSIDTMIETSFDEWIEENKENIEAKTVTESLKTIVTNIVDILQENNIEVPENDKDAIKILENKVEELSKRNDTLIENLVKKDNEILLRKKAALIEEKTKKLILTDREKVVDHMNKIYSKDMEQFESQLKSVMDIVAEKKIKTKKEEQLEENFTQTEEITEIDDFVL